MIDKTVPSVAQAVQGIHDGATVMIGGFGEAGSPIELIHSLIDQGASNLTVINNNTGSGEVGLAALIKAGRVSKMICSYPRSQNSMVFPDLYRAGKVELELVPQGTLAERIRAGGAGIPAFYTPASVGTPLQEGKELRSFGNQEYVLERGLRADYALLKARCADRYGNLLQFGINPGLLLRVRARLGINLSLQNGGFGVVVAGLLQLLLFTLTNLGSLFDRVARLGHGLLRLPCQAR